MADEKESKKDVQGGAKQHEVDSGTAKLARKKVQLRGNQDADKSSDSVKTDDLRERVKLSLKKGGGDKADKTTVSEKDDARSAQPPVTATDRVQKKLRLGTDTSTVPKAAGSGKRPLRPKSLAGAKDGSEERVQTQELLPHEMDPGRRRETDTANLKRIRPGKTSAEGVTAGGETGTDTIHLRVIKEKKNQLKNILSASQTIRLRPSPAESQAQAQKTTVQPAPETGDKAEKPEKAEAPAQKRTLKIKAPQPDAQAEEEPRTAMVSRDKVKPSMPTQVKRQSPPTASDQKGKPRTDTVKLPSPKAGGGKATLKIKAPAPGEKKQEEDLDKTQAPAQAEKPDKKTDTQPQPVKKQAPAKAGEGKKTLSIKQAAPPTIESKAPEAGDKTTDTAPVPKAKKEPDKKKKGKSTLKVKAPAQGAAVTQKAAAAGDQTVKQEAPAAGGGGKTLKLKAAPPGKTMKTPAAKKGEAEGEEEPAAARAPVAAKPKEGTAPGAVYTLAAAASFVTAAACLALFVYQWTQLF